MRIGIVGAGASGICMAARLLRAGVSDVVLYEKADAVGGTWRDNTYPGSGCDVPAHLYSFSFAPNPDWSRKFAEQPEILAYFQDLAVREGVLPLVQLGREVTAMSYDDRWTVSFADGSVDTVDVLVVASGQLNRPHVPDLPGLNAFAGTVFHTARWDHEHDLTGKDVVVVGSGATAVQFVPRIAGVARSVTILQRTPNWIAPKPDRVIPPWEKALYARVPAAQKAYRWSLYWRHEARWPAFKRDTRVNALFGAKLSTLAGKQTGGQLPEPAWSPDYQVGCKRVLVSNEWYATLLRPDVHVVTSPARAFDSAGVVTQDGTHHRADTVVLSTGFEASAFLGPVPVTGRDGVQLADVWRDGAEALYGMTVPGFPNLFLLYGPNTNLGHSSILFMVEQQVAHVLRCLRVLADGRGALEVRPAALARHRAAIERRMAKTAWAGSCRTWYKNAQGRVTQNWPASTAAYWREVRRLPLSSYARVGRAVR